MSGTSMPGDVEGERTYLTGANAEAFVTGATIDKSVTPSVATIGETVSYTVDTKLPDAYVHEPRGPWTRFLRTSTTKDVSDISLACFTTDSSYPNPVDLLVRRHRKAARDRPRRDPGATGQQIGWSFDALPNQDKHRIIRITYRVPREQPAAGTWQG